MSNIKIGNKCETDVCTLLRNKHYYVYHVPMKNGGQPVDIIAAKRDKDSQATVYLIDAKHVREGNVSFPLSRVEPNQLSTMRFAREWAGLKNLGFAIKFDRDDSLRWLGYDKLLQLLKEEKKGINMEELDMFEKVLL